MKERKPFKCNICDASFSEKGSLNKHVASVHEGKKPFQCTICDAKFGARGTLNSHVRTIHEGKNLSNAHL